MIDASRKAIAQTTVSEAKDALVEAVTKQADEHEVLEALEERARQNVANDAGSPVMAAAAGAADETVAADVDEQLPPVGPAKPSRLRDAMRRVRISEVERNDVIIDLRETEIARLEMLRDKSADVFDDVPDGADLIEGRVLPGTPPRLWIDVIAYVVMDRDKRTYRFVQETRNGRMELARSSNLDTMTGAITDYVAQRLIDRERALAADFALRPSTNGKVIAPQAVEETMDGDADDATIDAGPVGNPVIAKLADAEPDPIPEAERPKANARPVSQASHVSRSGHPEPVPVKVGHSSSAMFMTFLFGMIAGAFVLVMVGLNYIPA